MSEPLPAYLTEFEPTQGFEPSQALTDFLGRIANNEVILAIALHCDVASAPITHRQVHKSFQGAADLTPWIPNLISMEEYRRSVVAGGVANLVGSRPIRMEPNNSNRAHRIEAYTKLIPWTIDHPAVSTQVLFGIPGGGTFYPVQARLPMLKALLEAHRQDTQLEYGDVFEGVVNPDITDKRLYYHIDQLINRGIVQRQRDSTRRRSAPKLQLAPTPVVVDAVESLISITDRLERSHVITPEEALSNHLAAVAIAEDPVIMGALLSKAAASSSRNLGV